MRERHFHVAVNCIRNGHIFWLAKQAIKYFMIPLSQKIGYPICGPIEGIITPTYRCNADCIMCDIKRIGSKESELTFEEWVKVIDDMASIGVSGIGVSGGEPFLSHHLIKLVRYIKKKGIPVHISSNGSLVDEDNIAQLIDAGLDSIAISIDSCVEKIHDYLRGVTGSFRKAVEAVQLIHSVRSARKSNLRLTVASVISNQSISRTLDLSDFARRIGADTISFLPVMTTSINLDKAKRSEILSVKGAAKDEARHIIDELIRLKRKQGIIDNSEGYLRTMESCIEQKPFPAACFAGYVVCVVGADGRVFPCFDFLSRGRSIGNIRDKSLPEIWKSKQYSKMRKITAKCRECYLACHQEFNLLYKFL